MRRLSSGVALLCLLVPALAACGSDDDNDAGESGSVAVSGAFGEAPDVTYETPYVVKEVTTEVLEEGDGDVVEPGDIALISVYVGNGYTGAVATSSWESQMAAKAEDSAEESTQTPAPDESTQDDSGDTEGTLSAAGDEKPASEMIQVTSDGTLKPIYDGIVGQPVGSRVLVSSPGEDAFGLGGADYNIGNEDTTVFVIDVVNRIEPQLDASGAKQPKNAPEVVEKDGKVTGLDFSKAPKKAGDDLRVLTMVEGDGPAITNGDQIAMRYLGQSWGKKKSFDGNYDAAVPGLNGSLATIAKGAVIDGWVQGLKGVKAGSRVMLVIPSALAYGKDGSPDSGDGQAIGPNEDLVFVIDVLAVA
ncbi:FKBP-type peptidyl-prolyl cis-trans isomerase [Nocardioides alcanivorans]|uniref:FKBP-type peptidyl-prolyl cis-trans isomerase n=1 Tax=Nocardioides alcanivorans TaxID=2897352 RepID=UPI001F38BE04|nr:FKBP-type peptidyl-prolyl cis-trans isomerase [Nocardioides alcanivorans]